MAASRSVRRPRRLAARALCQAWLLALACSAATGAPSVDQPAKAESAAPVQKPKTWPDRIHVITETAQEPPSRQVAPDASIASLFPDSGRITLGLMFVPDPRVPRHRRAFDIAIGALSSGMLDAGYVLDRFTLPWSPAADDSDKVAEAADDGRFGLMIFRHDCWREPTPACRDATRRVVAMYLIPETVSYGVPGETVRHALACMFKQKPASTLPTPAGLPDCNDGAQDAHSGGDEARIAYKPVVLPDLLRSDLQGCERMLLVGPNFSGSVDSVARMAATTFGGGDGSTGICILSASATADHNKRLSGYHGAGTTPFGLTYYSLAVSDDVKVRALADLAQTLGAEKDPATHLYPLALLCEESVFGSGLCDEDALKTGASVRMRFPSNIADIRYHRHEAERKAAGDVPLDLSALDTTLHLDEGAENGSEFPDSQQSPLTAAGSELKLDKMLTILGRREPQIIAVAATDVRDRLFLFDQLRARVPDAVLVDLEADVLLAHPDFLHASRGILMLASHQLYDDRGEAEAKAAQRKSWRSYATDYEALTIKAISHLAQQQDPLVGAGGAAAGAPAAGRWPCLLVVARGGPRRANLWAHRTDDGVCLEEQMKQDPDDAWAWRERWGGAAALLLSILVVCWLGWRRGEWIRNDWNLRSPSSWIELLFLPLVALLLVSASLPHMAHSFQWLRSTLVVCAALSPLLAIHRTAIRVFESDSEPGRRWLTSGRALWANFKSLPFTMKVIWSVPAALNVTFLIVALYVWIAAGVQVPPGAARDWLRLAMDTNSGFGLLPALGIAYVTVLFGLACMVVGLHRHCRNDRVMDAVSATLELGSVRREVGKSMLLILYIALAYAVAMSLPLARSIFGPVAGRATCLAEIALSGQAIMFVLCALNAVRRADTFARTVYWSHARTKGERAAERRWKGLWGEWTSGPAFLSKTPFSASLQPVVETERRLSDPEQQRRLFCGAGEQAAQIVSWIGGERGKETAFGVWAIYRLLVSEVSALRWSAFGALFSCLALVVVVYEFPAPGADNFLLLGLGLMLLAGMITAYSVITLERSKWISRVLCNTSERVEFSWSYFAYLLSPVLLLSLAIAIVQEPGVLVWGNGLMSMLKYVGLLR